MKWAEQFEMLTHFYQKLAYLHNTSVSKVSSDVSSVIYSFTENIV